MGVIGSFQILQGLLFPTSALLLVLLEGPFGLLTASLPNLSCTQRACLSLISFCFSSSPLLLLSACSSASLMISSSCLLSSLFSVSLRLMMCVLSCSSTLSEEYFCWQAWYLRRRALSCCISWSFCWMVLCILLTSCCCWRMQVMSCCSLCSSSSRGSSGVCFFMRFISNIINWQMHPLSWPCPASPCPSLDPPSKMQSYGPSLDSPLLLT